MNVSSLSPKQKIAAGVAAGGVFLALSLCCCGGGIWGVSSWNAKREEERIEAKKKKDFEDLQAALGKAFNFGNPADIDGKLPDGLTYLSPAEPTNLDGVRFEILRGESGKIKFRGGKESSKDHLQVHYRITNTSESKIIKTTPWTFGHSDSGRKYLFDEFGNGYRGWREESDRDQIVNDGFTQRLDPGKSIDGVAAFEMPVEKASEFKLALPSAFVDRPGYIAYKLPRSFFEKK